jgi:hypothetical protein
MRHSVQQPGTLVAGGLRKERLVESDRARVVLVPKLDPFGVGHGACERRWRSHRCQFRPWLVRKCVAWPHKHAVRSGRNQRHRTGLGCRLAQPVRQRARVDCACSAHGIEHCPPRLQLAAELLGRQRRAAVQALAHLLRRQRPLLDQGPDADDGEDEAGQEDGEGEDQHEMPAGARLDELPNPHGGRRSL